MSSDYQRNLSSGIINPFISSTGNSFDRVMSGIQDAMEGLSLNPFRRANFKGVVLSGYSSGIFQATDGMSVMVNAAEPIDWGDGMVRWKMHFAIHEKYYDTDIGKAFTLFYGKSPLQSGISEEDRQARIRKMPYAYTDLDNSFYSSLRFGSIINIRERNGTFFAINSFGDVASVSSSDNKDNSKNKFDDGSPITFKPGAIQPPANWDKAWLPVPSPDFYQSSGFKKRKPPPTKWKDGKAIRWGRAYHPGIDFSNFGRAGAAIVSIYDGIVVRNRYSGGYGNQVEIYHPKHNIISQYNHMLKLSTLIVGNMIKQKGIVGQVGSTGSSNAPHLHFEVWKPVKPASIIDTSTIKEKGWAKKYLSQRGVGMAGTGALKCNPKTIFCPVNPLKETDLMGWTLMPKDKKKYKTNRRVYGYITN